MGEDGGGMEERGENGGIWCDCSRHFISEIRVFAMFCVVSFSFSLWRRRRGSRLRYINTSTKLLEV